jgi:hypothetical protein
MMYVEARRIARVEPSAVTEVRAKLRNVPGITREEHDRACSGSLIFKWSSPAVITLCPIELYTFCLFDCSAATLEAAS